MSNIITVSHKKTSPTGQIIINNFQNTEKDKIIETNTFFNLNLINNKQRNDLNNDDNVFTAEQEQLRALDCIKDGSVDPKINEVKKMVYSNFNNNKFNNFNIEELLNQHFSLTELEEKFSKKNNERIKKYSWVKLSKDSNLSPIIEQRIIFKESGLDPGRFIKDPIFCVNFANEIIDPAGRSPRTAGDIIFPENNKTLKLDESFLSLFGFTNCSVEATRKSDKKYNYTIKINQIKITGTGTENGKMTTILREPSKTKMNQVVEKELKMNQWFEGNKIKNGIINKLPTDKQKQIIVNTFLNVKEMGDVLQVLIMLIWKNYNNNNQMYSIATCDKVVCLLCMILNLNCILTYAEKKPNLRLYSIDVFEATGYSVFDIMNKFNYETGNIIKHNQAYIDCISTFDESTAIYISALGNDFYFHKNFYELIIADMNMINSELIQYVKNINNEKKNDEINTLNIYINNEIEKIKSFFTLNVFFRKSKQRGSGQKITMILTKNYTKNLFLLTTLNTKLNRTKFYDPKLSFFEIAKQMSNTFETRMNGGNSNKSTTNSSNSANNDKLYDILKFDDEYEDEMDVSETMNEEINEEIKDFRIKPLYDELNRNIEEIVSENNVNYFLIDIKSELYYEFFIKNRVEYDDNLKEMIMTILDNFKLLISPPTTNTKRMNKTKNNALTKQLLTKKLLTKKLLTKQLLTKQPKKFNNSMFSKRGKRIDNQSKLRETKRMNLLMLKRNSYTRKRNNSQTNSQTDDIHAKNLISSIRF